MSVAGTGVVLTIVSGRYVDEPTKVAGKHALPSATCTDGSIASALKSCVQGGGGQAHRVHKESAGYEYVQYAKPSLATWRYICGSAYTWAQPRIDR